MKKEYSHAGEFFPSEHRQYQEIIFFVHFYSGNKKNLRRHVEYVNGLGFDAFVFNLQGGTLNKKDLMKLRLPLSITARGKFGTKHLYAEQIEQMLNEVSGKKIIYSFSNPSASAMEAMARRKCYDTTAMICDSGPSGQFIISSYYYFQHEWKINSKLISAALAPILTLGWSAEQHRDIPEHLNLFPEHFPILSIRGWKDPLVSPQNIDAVFEKHSNLDWQKLNLPEAGHLNGLRDYPNDYKPGVERFLKSVATPI